MIDIENELFTAIQSELKSQFENISVYGETILAPSTFPCVCIEEADNYSYLRTRDSSSNECHAVVVYEVNVFSNKKTGKKSECKSIAAVIDEIMNGLGFTRNTKNPITLDDATKYRLFLRYTCVVSKEKNIYRR